MNSLKISNDGHDHYNTPKNEEAFAFHVGLTLSIQEGSEEMEKLIDSTVVGAALRLSLFVRQEGEDAYRYYKFFASGALRDELESINWNEF